MSILSRLTRRNIFGKPFRSFAIIIALAASAFAMLFCVAGRKAPEQELRRVLLNAYGGAELMIIDSEKNLDLNAADFPDGTQILYVANASATAETPNGEYAVRVTYFDTAAAKKANITDSEYAQTDGLIIPEKIAQQWGLSAGSTVTLEGDEASVTLKVTSISDDKYLRRNTKTFYAGLDTVKALSGAAGTGYSAAYANVPDETDVNQLAADLTAKYSGQSYIFSPVLTDEMLAELDNETMVFYLIFAVILLLTLFLTFSMSRHIANERLSVIGTLRSLGGSIAKTSRVLLAESTVYGLIGGVIGCIGFALLGNLAISAMFGSNWDGWHVPLLLYLSAVIMTVVIQLICQSGALLKAVRTPVRDIIFSSRDTSYVLRIPRVIIGTVLFAAGVTVGMLTEDILLSIAAITLICVGAVMMLPIVLRLLSAALAKLFQALHMPCAKLAAKELSHKKSTVAGTQLTFAALSITAAIFIVSASINRIYHADIYHFDARIDAGMTEEKTEEFMNRPEITAHENLFNYYGAFKINDNKKRNICIAGYGEFKLFPSIRGLGEKPAENEIYIGASFAKRLGIKAGDTVRLEDCESYDIDENGNPVYSAPYEMKVKGLCNTTDHYNETIVVSTEWFKAHLGDWVNNTFIMLAKPEDIKTVRTALEKADRYAEITSVEEVIRENDENSASLMTVLYSITAIGCVLAVLGAVSNAIIGFEQAKRKYAVLHSVAANKRKLCRLILLETLFSALIAAALALLNGVLLTALIRTAMSALGMGIEIMFDLPRTLTFIGIIVAVLLLSAVRPMLSLRKMNTAAELKYE
ncbi:MAG: FtsX-like permease family protein [Oscillospiraceae bacterium]|nr:FtsX-like permease family protein [Oscillospiraceae bacterium]